MIDCIQMKNYKCKVCDVMNLNSYFTNQDALMKHVKCHFWMVSHLIEIMQLNLFDLYTGIRYHFLYLFETDA